MKIYANETPSAHTHTIRLRQIFSIFLNGMSRRMNAMELARGSVRYAHRTSTHILAYIETFPTIASQFVEIG